MARRPFDALVTEKTLAHMNQGSLMADAVMGCPLAEDGFEIPSDATPEQRAALENVRASVPLTKNVCARVSPQLADEIDNVVSLLGISKRRFLEAAFIEAVNRANEIMENEGLFDQLRKDQAA